MLWLFLPFVVVLSGVVAYAADTIARKAGRKHIRLFGLRPKTTALLVAVASGMAISAASLAAFLLLNRNAVSTIAEADQLRPRIEALRKEVGAVQGELKSAQAERDQAQREADKSAKLQAGAEEKLAAIRTQLETTRAAEKTLKAETKTLQGQVDEQTANLKTLEVRAAENRVKLQKSEQALKASQARAQTLDSQVVELNTRVALAEQEAQSAQERADTAQATAQTQQDKALTAQATAKAEQERALVAQATARKQVQVAQASVQQAKQSAAAQISAAGKQVTDLKTQVAGLEQSRQQAANALTVAVAAAAAAKQQQQVAQQARDTLAAQRDQLTAQRNALTAQRDALTTQRDELTAQRDKLVADGVRLARERDQAAKERTQATADRDKVRKDLGTLQQQQQQLRASNDELKNSNDSLARALADARASLGRLQDENLSSRTELSASRNTDLAYPKNELVYAAVVPGVRNLDEFLKDAAGAAQARGAKATASAPSARLSGTARTALETKLRGLNVSTFVQCRAAQNAAVGFPVDLSCDARPNTVLYRGGEVIRRGSITLGSDPRAMQDQISDLVKDAVTDITTRGVPSEYILNKGLDVSELVTLIDRLSKRTGSTAVVGVAARDDVRPSMRVDLYPVLP
ncbi:DUF3084 domain-containing protein [Deinococcus marmoris]|uniref:Type V secretory pathway, adhesin AidA n=1 Tax=Deinococcus marmoris TaxID=249408 RepID=A0A1U7P255_9DEIO|nr:DUF3084 domain-containing protein [Deinococcus marmoris]OLV19252.1 Type V secretory pathway, adhesin AidA [Deinococcus marmoris]